MMVLDNLKSLGYEVEVKENGIKLSYKGKGAPDKSRVVPLLEELKANKDKVIKKLKRVRKTHKIYSKILEDYLWIVATDKELQGLVDEGINETIYTQEEVSKMIDGDVTKEGLKAIHRVKKFFPGSSVEDISNEN
jgi:hypothetical protein